MTISQEDVLREIDQLKDIVPSEESTRRAIAKASDAFLIQPEKKTKKERGSIMNQKSNRSTWRFVLGGGLAASVVAIAFFLSQGGDSIAFAEVQQELKKHRTVIYNFVSGDADKRVTTRFIISGTRRRTEYTGGFQILVPEKKAMLHIDHKKRTAIIGHDNSGKQRVATDFYSKLVSMAEPSVKEIGKRTIDGKRTIGFEVLERGNGDPMQVWVDVSTRLPVRVEAIGNRVLQDFEYGTDVPEDLFDLTVPKGYFVQNRYLEPQSPIALEKNELSKHVALVTALNRTPQQTVDAFLKLAAAGKTQLVAALQRRPASDDIRELDGFEKLELTDMLATDTNALGVTSVVIADRGKLHALVFTLKKIGGVWLIDDIDFESADGVKKEMDRFQEKHPDAKDVP